MEQKEKLLEKALKRFERTNPKRITEDQKPGLEPNWYSIRVDGFRLVLTQQNYHNQEPKVEKYELEFIYLHKEREIIKFENDERIKKTYQSVEQKYKMYIKEKEDKNKEKEKRKFEKSLKRLDRIL